MSHRRWAWGMLAWFASGAIAADLSAPVVVPRIIATFSHDQTAYTEGLLWHDGLLFESAGRYGRSSLSVRNLKSGRVLRRRALPSDMFGEGLALVGNELVQLTWKEKRAYVYDKSTLQLKRTLPYAWEGWGLTFDGEHLIASDGSAVLRFLDPATLKQIRSIEVHDDDRAIGQLNELEYVHGEILANVFETDRIARISPTTGQVIGWLDLSGLLPDARRPAADAVLNGIAYDPMHNVLIVTGKNWPKLFVIPAP